MCVNISSTFRVTTTVATLESVSLVMQDVILDPVKNLVYTNIPALNDYSALEKRVDFFTYYYADEKRVWHAWLTCLSVHVIIHTMMQIV